LSPSSGPAPLTTGVEAPPGISAQARRTLDGAVFGPDGLRWDAQAYLDLVWAWQLERVKPGQKSSDGDLRMQGALDRQFADYERPDVTRCNIGP